MNLNEMLNEIEEAAANNIQPNAGDYFNEQGLLMCCKCNTAKQVEIELFGEKRRPMCLCKCMKEKLEADEEYQKRKEHFEKVKRLRNTGFPDTEMKKWTFEKDDGTNRKISKIARNYVENFPEMLKSGQGLLFFGNVGTGKTFFSACIANALTDKGYPCLVTNFARLVNIISGMHEGKQKYLDSLNQFDLLVVDDLAAERDTEYMGETIHNIIDARYRSGKPLIVTTNLNAKELNNPSETRKKRIYSRLFEMCIPVQIEGKDRRKQKLQERLERFGKLLEIRKTAN